MNRRISHLFLTGLLLSGCASRMPGSRHPRIDGVEPAVLQAARAEAARLDIPPVEALIRQTRQASNREADSSFSHPLARKTAALLEMAIESRPGESALFRALGRCRHLLGDWKGAADALNRAVQLHDEFAFLPRDPMSLDFSPARDTTLYALLYELGDVQARLYRATEARHALQRAQLLAPQAARVRIADYLKWMAWAGGDIRSRELFDEAARLEASQSWRPAAEMFQNVLARLDSGSAAFYETAWRLSKVEEVALAADSAYSEARGDRIGVFRLARLIDVLPADSLGIPVDSAQTGYFSDLGRMRRNRALAAQKAGARNEAEQWFALGAAHPSPVQAECALWMVTLRQNDRHTGRLWGLKAFTLVSDLNRDQRMALWQLMRRVVRRPRNPWLAAWYNAWFARNLGESPSRLDAETAFQALACLRLDFFQLDALLFENWGIHQSPQFLIQVNGEMQRVAAVLSSARRRRLEDDLSDYFYRLWGDDPQRKWIFEAWRRSLGRRHD